MVKRKSEDAGASSAGDPNSDAAVRPKRQVKTKPMYVQEKLVFAQRLPKSKPKKPKKHTPAPPASGDGSSGMRRRNNQYTVGRPIQGARGTGGGGNGASGGGMKGRGGGGRAGGQDGGDGTGSNALGGKLRGGNRQVVEPLLRGSKAAEEWGWKNQVEEGQPLCPLYYGCPEPPLYFCCERHKVLWQEGTLLMARMPEEWKEAHGSKDFRVAMQTTSKLLSDLDLEPNLNLELTGHKSYFSLPPEERMRRAIVRDHPAMVAAAFKLWPFAPKWRGL